MSITCGNRDRHQGQVGEHFTTEGVRACFLAPVTFTCGWLVERTYTVGDDESGYEGYTVTEECGALAWTTDQGWVCDAGHEHLTYGSEAQQAEERVEAMVEALASRDGSVAARLDAGESWRRIAGI
jgi:hypothetical protein